MHVWRIRSTTTPTIRHQCATCGQLRSFESTGMFRVNSQKRRIDVWLIYRCETCGARWNREIHSRQHVRNLEPDQLEGFLANDESLARQIAFDTAGLDKGSLCFREDSLEIEKVTDGNGALLTIELCFVEEVKIRLEKLLANELGLSRSRLAGLFSRGAIRIFPKDRRALRKPAKDGQRVIIETSLLG